MDKQSTELWVEKYRPSNFDDIVLEKTNKRILTNILEMEYFPNLLFYGPPGTGKTTTILNLINTFQKRYSRVNKNTVIHLNASDERGIDVIRNQINLFANSMNLFEKGLKFVVLDEVDYMTKNAQHALKYIIQTNSCNIRFCLICNYITKIDESLKKELITLRFNQLPKSYILDFLRKISVQEKLFLKEETLETIQNTFQSDIRSMVNFIQLHQNFNIEEWQTKIITKQVFEDFYQLFPHGESVNLLEDTVFVERMNEILSKLQHNSIQYNIDKREFLLKYFDYVVRFHREICHHSFFNKMETIVHNTEEVPIEHLIGYLLC